MSFAPSKKKALSYADFYKGKGASPRTTTDTAEETEKSPRKSIGDMLKNKDENPEDAKKLAIKRRLQKKARKV